MKRKQYFGEYLKAPSNDYIIDYGIKTVVNKGMKFGAYLVLGTMSFWKSIKKAVKPVIEAIEGEEDVKKLKDTIYTILDQNGDGKLSIDDFFFCVRVKLGMDKTGKPDIWEIIGALLTVRKVLKECKK